MLRLDLPNRRARRARACDGDEYSRKCDALTVTNPLTAGANSISVKALQSDWGERIVFLSLFIF